MTEKIIKIIKYSIGGFLVLVAIMFIAASISGTDVKEDVLQYQIAEQDDTSYLNCKRVGFHVLVPDDATQQEIDYTLEQIIEDKKSQWNEVTIWAYGYSEKNKIGQGFTKGMREYSTCL